jgi:hypothetical protein
MSQESFCTSSSHLSLGLFTSLLPSDLFSKILLVILIWSILITCSDHSNLFHLISTMRSGVLYCHTIGYVCRWTLDWWPDLLDSLVHWVTTLYSSLLHTQVTSHVFTVAVLEELPTADVPLPLASQTVKLSCAHLVKHQSMKMYRGVKV